MAMSDQAEETPAAAEARTTRLVCRRPRASDGEHYRSLLLEPEVERWLRPSPLPGFRPDEPDALLRKDLIHWETHGFGPWTLVSLEESEFVGRGGLAWTQVAGENAIELPWALMPRFWNQGLATEAAMAAVETARRLGISDVVSLALLDNQASRRVMEKAGLRYAGEIQHVGLPHALYRLAIAGR